MSPSVCPVCAGRGTVPAALYESDLPPDWEPGDLAPMIYDGIEPAEADCQSCNNTGIVWPPGNREHGYFDTADSTLWSYTIPTGGKVSVSGMFGGWGSDHTEKVSLSLVTDEEED